MGIVNVFRGLGSEREIHRFNGRIGNNLDLDWRHCRMLLGDREITKNHAVREDDVVYIREYPGILGTLLLVGLGLAAVATGVVGIVSGVKARDAARDARRKLDDALNRIGNDNRRRDVESIPHLSGARNEFAEGKQAPIILGRHLFAPYLLSEPYMRPGGTDGEDLYWYGSLLVGQTGLSLERLRNGTIGLVSFGGDGETESGTYPFDRPSDLDPDGPPPFYDPENKVEVRQGGYFAGEIFNDRWKDSLDSDAEIGRKRKDNAATLPNINSPDAPLIFIDDDGPEPVIRESARFPMRVEVEIRVDGLHGWDSENGEPTNVQIAVKVEWSPDGVGDWTSVHISGWTWTLGMHHPGITDPNPGPHNRLIRNTTRQMRFIAPIDLPPSVHSDDGKPVYIRVTRLTHQHVGSIRSRTVLTAIRTRQYSPRNSSSTGLVPARNMAPSLADKFCRIGIKMKVNANTQEHMDRFNVIASMTGRTWDGSRWSLGKKATSNPAAVALEVLTGLIHEPSRHGDSEIDLDTLGRLYAWCDSREVTVAGSGLRPVRLESCGALVGATRKIDALRRILATCDAGMYMGELGKLRFWYDDFKDTPIGLLNPQRLVSMTETRDLSRRLDGYAVRFVDRDGDWSERTERVLRPRVAEVPGRNTFDPFDPEYVTDYHHAMWLARRSMAREILQPGEITVEVGRHGRHYVPGSLIKVSHEGFRIGIGSGEIVENIVEGDGIVGIRTMERFDIHEDRDYWVDFHVVDGNRNHVVTRQIRSVNEYTDILTFSAPIPLGHDAPAMGNIVSVIDGLREGFARVWESKRCVVMDSSPSGKGYRLTLARYDDEIYRTGAIDAIPEYRSRILPTAPRVYRTPPMLPRDGRDGEDGIDGEDGRGMLSVTFRFMRTGSSIPPPADHADWSETAPTLDNDHRFLWSRERFAFTDGTHLDFVTLKAQMGPGVASMAFHFMRTDVDRAPAKDHVRWTPVAPSLDNTFRWLWSRETLVFNDGRPDMVTVTLKAGRGGDGMAGRFTDYRFAVSAAVGTPPSPHTPNANNPGDNWRDEPPAVGAGQFLWLTKADWREGSRLTNWSAPARITGPQGATGNYYALIFRRAATRPATPTGNSPSGWGVNPPDGSDYLWMSRGTMTSAGTLVGQWSQPSRISGEHGRDGRDGTNGTNGVDGQPAWEVWYRGVTATADTANTGIVNGLRMNPGNFVMFTGTTTGIWQTARLMQWQTNRTWLQLPVASNRHLYQQAVNDITAGAASGIFSVSFIGQLFADMAMVNVLDVLCTLRLGTNGAIVSQDFAGLDGGVDGFRLLANGLLEAIGIRTRGMRAAEARLPMQRLKVG